LRVKHLFVTQASMGHLLPAIRLARLVQDRGHQVRFVASDIYSGVLDLHGLPHVPVSNSNLPFLSTYDWYDVNTVGIQVRLLHTLVDRDPPDVVITGPLGLAAFIVAESRSLLVVVLGYGEYLYPGLRDQDPIRWWRLRTVTDYYNDSRRALGLKSVEALPDTSPLLGGLYLLRGVPQFTSPRLLPPQVRHVGGLYWEPEYQNPAMERFLDRCRKHDQRIVYVQLGRLFGKSWVWTRLMNLLGELGVACVADVGRADYLQDDPHSYPHCFACRFAPLGSVTGADAVICSGHTASVLGAMTHRTPLLCIPTSADAEESADRVVQCGLGMKINYERELTVDQLQRFLRRADGGDFAVGLRRFSDYLETWKTAEPELGDIALPLIERNRDTTEIVPRESGVPARQ
jgi:hypothetical protein